MALPVRKKPVAGRITQANTVLAIDPGPEMSAYVVWDGKTIFQHGHVENWTLREICLPEVELIAIEMIASYGMSVGKTTFETCVEIGRFVEAFLTDPCRLVYRKDIKMHLCGSMRAKDANIRQALIDRIGPQGVKKNPGPTYGIKSHTWASLAVAVYAWDTLVNENA